jgi:hypothetical protein
MRRLAQQQQTLVPANRIAIIGLAGQRHSSSSATPLVDHLPQLRHALPAEWQDYGGGRMPPIRLPLSHSPTLPLSHSPHSSRGRVLTIERLSQSDRSVLAAIRASILVNFQAIDQSDWGVLRERPQPHQVDVHETHFSVARLTFLGV